MAYQQTLYKVVQPIQEDKYARMNSKRLWKYGYNKEHDIIVISKSGRIGEIYEISGIKIGLPQPEKVYKRSKTKKDQYWETFPYPAPLKRIKTIFDWDGMDESFKRKYTPYISEEFRRREDGFWFKNNGVDTYITGSYYMYLQWSKIDIGHPDYREANRLFFIFWEACKADNRCYGMSYLKNRRSGFSFMSSAESVNLATSTSESQFGILSKSGEDAKSMFTNKVVPISIHYPFFFKPIQDGMDRPKTEIAYRVPATRFTRKRLDSNERSEEIEGLNTTINWKSTGNNSYDGEKLKLLIHDEAYKWLKPNNIKKNWRVTKTCLQLGKRIVGKCMMGSTCNSQDEGGREGKELYMASKAEKRNKNGQTVTGLYSLFIPMEWNYEGFIDKYGMPVFDTPKEPVEGIDGEMIDVGVIEHWENEAEGLKDDGDALNEFYRQFPRTEEHAFRDKSENSLFDLTKIYEQVDYNSETVKYSGLLTRGNFQWDGGVKDSTVSFHPSKEGRFLISWIPPRNIQNRIIKVNGRKSPANEHLGAFGCDPYDISGTVGKDGSKGSLHGLTKFNMEESAPSNAFFLEYIARPQTAEIFFEDVLMAIVFYGMPLLAENNRPRLLYYLKRRGYRGYSMNRPDKLANKLSPTEREIGGIPNSSEDIIHSHASAIESYITKYVGMQEDGSHGDMYFNRTLNDWANFDITKRTKYDASISSGLAIMACNKTKYYPKAERETAKVNINIAKYDNTGLHSEIIVNG